MESLAKFFGHDFENGSFKLFDKNGKLIYYIDSDDYWEKREYNKNGKLIYYIDSGDYWLKKEYDDNNNEIYLENSVGYWSKREYNEDGKQIYFEDLKGIIFDNRPKTIDKEIMIDGKKYKLVEK